MIKLEGPVELAPPFAGSGKAGPTHQRKLQKESWPLTLMGEFFPLNLGNMVPSLTMGIGEVSAPRLRGWERWKGGARPQWLGFTRVAITQAHNRCLGLAHCNFYPIYDLLEHVKRLVLCNNICRISKTQGNHKTSQRSCGEDPGRMMY